MPDSMREVSDSNRCQISAALAELLVSQILHENSRKAFDTVLDHFLPHPSQYPDHITPQSKIRNFSR